MKHCERKKIGKLLASVEVAIIRIETCNDGIREILDRDEQRQKPKNNNEQRDKQGRFKK